MTAGRTYLSIGDVLTLLRQEFPDVTISKIRFLESQGLVNPERTPSGYRKFYDHDVERLRWVLRQQREHFLPLKVIKGRLDDVETGSEAELEYEQPAAAVEPAENGGNGIRLVETAGVAASRRAEPSGAGGVATMKAPAQSRLSQTTGRESYAGEPSGRLPGFHPEPHGGELLRETADSRAVGRHESGRQEMRVQGQRPSLGAPQAEDDSTAPVGRGTTTATATAARPSAGSGGADRQPTGRGAGRSTVPQVKSDAPDLAKDEDETPEYGRAAGTGSRRLTSAELAQAAGLTESDVEELGSYGILSGRTVGGVVHYDESDVAIAQIAAGFAQFGIEPRHLRMYKHASDREAGFVEQLVLPLLKQRNPEARKRASDMADELTRLGQGLRAALVRRGLQDLLGG
jgi:DNA-binding transcriptional MerR regulator